MIANEASFKNKCLLPEIIGVNKENINLYRSQSPFLLHCSSYRGTYLRC